MMRFLTSLFLGAMLAGYAANIFKIIMELGNPQVQEVGFTIFRILGIFLFPLGCLLGFF